MARRKWKFEHNKSVPKEPDAQVEIFMSNGQVITEPAWIFGQVAVHTKISPVTGEEVYTITHVLSGWSVSRSRGFEELETAIEFARTLAQIDLDAFWDDYQDGGFFDPAGVQRAMKLWKEFKEYMAIVKLSTK